MYIISEDVEKEEDNNGNHVFYSNSSFNIDKDRKVPQDGILKVGAAALSFGGFKKFLGCWF